MEERHDLVFVMHGMSVVIALPIQVIFLWVSIAPGGPVVPEV
jgi:hypothetical protein